MSREIKFRAYIKSIGWVVPVERINFDVQTVEVDLTDGDGDFFEYDFGEVELMQFTGLKDKNGTEVYEGDIVKTKHNNEVLIKWINTRLYPCRQGKTGQYNKVTNWYCVTMGEVIGNIWENPELLK